MINTKDKLSITELSKLLDDRPHTQILKEFNLQIPEIHEAEDIMAKLYVIFLQKKNNLGMRSRNKIYKGFANGLHN